MKLLLEIAPGLLSPVVALFVAFLIDLIIDGDRESKLMAKYWWPTVRATIL
jgi:hypothetical protein